MSDLDNGRGHSDDLEDPEPKEELRRLAHAAWTVVSKALRYSLICFYYGVWTAKESVRGGARQLALGFLFVSLIILAVHVWLELAGESLLTDLLKKYPHNKWYFIGSFFAAIVLLIIHIVREYLTRRSEFALANMLWLLFATRDTTETVPEFVKFLLPHISMVFKAFAACGSCIWVPENGIAGPLHVPNGFKFPPHIEILDRLENGTGIASVAFNRVQPCYVPRTYIPMNSHRLARVPIVRSLFARSFPHGFRFKSGLDPETKEFDLTETFIITDKVIPMHGTCFGPFKSFIAVPLVSKKYGGVEVLGVLCIHFKGTDTLDRLGVKLASMVANIVADELLRLRQITRSSNEEPKL